MLGFFRRYQQYFFLVITFVIIVSFSFFGTYNTIPAENIRDQVAFVAIDGSEVKRSDLEEMVLFLSTDADDKVSFGGVWGPNFLNDGVFRKDFLQTGLAGVLAVQYEPSIASDMQKRLEKEKRFVLYSHPEAPFLNVEAVWEYFAPDMKSNYNALKKSSKAAGDDAFMARVRLYLGERRLPPPMLRQVLRYQEKQNSWVVADPNLDRIDLSLFGYHTFDDWFGPNFTRIVAQFIINASRVAEQKGYVVTKEEALADLAKNAQASFQENLKNPHLSVANSSEYLNEQLRRMGMDQAMAVKVWKQVLLFRRLFQDIGQSVLVDPFSFQQVDAYAKQSASGDLFQLPKELQLSDYNALQKLEAYLTAISKRPTEEAKLLTLPTTFFSAEEVAKKYPELVQKRYYLELTQADKKKLQAQVGVKDSWNWQVEDKNWAVLKKEFPELGIKKADTREERFAALEGLDGRTRNRVDVFSRNALLDAHPEWIEKALSDSEAHTRVVGLAIKGDSPPFVDLKDPKVLMKLLDEAPLAGDEASASESAKKAQAALNLYTSDNQRYYRIRVLERKPDLEILTFAEANKKGVLDGVLDAQLEAYYQQSRNQNPTAYQKEDKTWKPLAEVKAAVIDQYFAKILRAIRSDYAKAVPNDKKQELTNGDLTAPYRFYSYARTAKETLEKDSKNLDDFVREARPDAAIDRIDVRPPLTDQWKLEKKEYLVERAKEEKKLNPFEVFASVLGSWTSVETTPNGDVYFFHKTGDAGEGVSSLVANKIEQARRLLSDDAQRSYMKHLVAEIKQKNAISLDYLNQTIEMSEEPSSN